MEGCKKSIRTIALIICMALIFTSFPSFVYAAAEDEFREPDAGEEIIGEEGSLEDTLILEEEASEENALIEESTEDSTTFDLGDGKKMVIYHGQDVRYEEEGELVDYDPALVEVASDAESINGKDLTGYKFENKQGDKKNYIPEKLSEDTPVLMENDKYSIEMVPLEDETTSSAQVEAEESLTPYETVEEKEVTAVYEVKDKKHRYEYTSLNEGIKETIVLEENPEDNVFEFKLNVKGLKAQDLEDENTIVFTDEETEDVKAVIEKPFMNDRSEEAYSEDLEYDLEEGETDSEYILTLTVSREYLDDEERLYPVTIDPTATWQGEDTFLDAYVISGSVYGDINFYDSGTKVMPVGVDVNGYTHRTYIKFPNVKANLGDKYIDSAYLTVYETAQCKADQSVRFSRITEDWSPSTITWNNKPTYYSSINTITTTGTTYASHKIAMTNTFRNYVNETNNPNYGIVARNVTTDPTYAEFFGSRTSASSYRPKLVITYYDKPTALETLTVARNVDGEYVTSSYMKKGYKVYATWTGIESHNLADVQYKIIAGDDSTAEPTSIGDDGVDLTQYRSIGVATSSGTNVHVPYAGSIPEGKYRLYVRGKDAGGMYGSAKYRVFYVDGDTPSLTGVSVSPSTSSASPSTDLTPTVSWNASDAYFSKVTVSLNGTVLTTVTTEGAGSYTIPSDKIKTTGTHTIKVTVTDKVGKTTSVSKSYYADTLAPSLTDVAVSPSTSSSSLTTDLTPQVLWNATDTNFKNVTISLDDTVIKTVTVSGSNSYTLPSGTITGSGTYKIKVTASDKAGRTTSKTLTYYVDNDAPVFSSASSTPSTSSSAPSGTLIPVIKWNVSDDNLSKVTISVNGGSEVKVATAAGAGTYTIPEGTITASGKQTIKITAYDKAGSTASKTISYYADAYLPQIKTLETSPVSGTAAPTNDLAPTINWHATDYYFSKTEIYLGSTLVYTSTVDGAGSYTLPSGKITKSGEYTIQLKCYDKAGKTNTKSLTYYVDATKPVINSIDITPKTSFLNRIDNKSPKVTWKVTDTNLKSVMYSLDGTNYTEMGTIAEGSYDIPSSAWTNGNGKYTIYIKATDKAGNVSSITKKTYYLGEEGSHKPQNVKVSESYGKRIITWALQAYDPDNSQYNLHRGSSADFTLSEDTLIAEDIDASCLYYIDNEVLAAGTYYYKLEVRDLTGDENAEDIESDEVSIENTVTADDFNGRTGFKDYLSYFEFGTPTGTGYIEKSSGNVMYSQDDFSVSNSQLDFGLSRTYNSSLGMTGMFGAGWSDSYHKELYVSGNTIYFLNSDGSVLKYINTNGIYSCEQTKEYSLTKVSDGYTLEDKSGIVHTFNDYGQLMSISEPNGCRVEYSYDQMGRLLAVTSYGQQEAMGEVTEAVDTLTFTYEDASYALKEVKDLLGNSYSYEYDGNLLTKAKVTDRNSSANSVSYVYGYSAEGLLNKAYDAIGNCYEVTYSSGKGSKVTYPNGEYYDLAYGSSKTDVTKVNENGNEVYTESVSYDTNTGKITSITDVKGRVTSYSYENDNPYLVTKEVSKSYYQSLNGDTVILNNEKSETVTYSYDEDENIIEEESTDGSKSVYTYDDDNNLETEVVTEDGSIINDITYSYDENGNLLSCKDTEEDTLETYSYDAAGNQISSKSFNGAEITNEDNFISSSSMQYDEMGNPVTEVTKSGKIETTVNSRYDEMGTLILSTEDRKEKGVSTLDPSTAVSITKEIKTKYINDYLGRTVRTDTEITQYDEDTESNVTSTYSEYMEYNDNGSLIKETDKNGKVIVYEFDSLNRNIKTTVSGSNIDTAVSETVYGYAANVRVEDGINGRSEGLTYTETSKVGTSIISVRYMDIEGNVIKEETGEAYTCYTYDNDGTQVVSYAGSTSEDEYLINLSLEDSDGNVFANVSNAKVSGGSYVIGTESIKTLSTYDSEGNLLTETDGKGIVTAYTYDADNRITTCSIDGNGDVSVSYDETDDGILTTTITDARGNQKVEVTDAAGLTTSITDKGATDSERIASNYTYDSLGNNILIEYSDSSYITNEFDVNGRIYRSKSYTSDGNLEKIAEYEYDINGNLTVAKLVDADGVTEKYRENFTYDVNGSLIEKCIIYESDDEKKITYDYDSQGRLTSVTYPDESNLKTVSYGYDSLGNLLTIKQDGKAVTEYSYDGFYRISQRKDYTAPGETTYILRTYSYDAFGRVTSMVYSKNGQEVLESYSYVYDKNSNIVSETHVNNLEESKINETKTYTYDSSGRLTKTVTADHNNSNAESTVTYSYDSVGNRTGLTDSSGTTTYTYNGLNQLTEKTDSSGKTTYTYDGRGNQIKEVTPTATTNFTYAVTGEMLTVAEGSTVVQENEYNHEGIRISKSEDGTERKYLYDNGSVVYTIDNESVSSANVLGGYQNVVGSYRGEDYYTYSKDIQGSTSSITDSNFTASAIYEYSDFGEVTEVVESIDNEICYTGAIHDETTGLHYMNARYYDPANGRFISQDSYRGSVNDPGQWHLYVYCANNPINYMDPSGHKREWIGYGVQAELAIGNLAGGIDIVYLFSKVSKRYKNKSVHAYLFGAASADNEDILDAVIDILSKPKSLLKKSSLKSLLGSGFSFSVTFFCLYGEPSSFHYKKSYNGKAGGWTVIINHVKIAMSMSNAAISIGTGFSKSKFGISTGGSISIFNTWATGKARNISSSVLTAYKEKARNIKSYNIAGAK